MGHRGPSTALNPRSAKAYVKAIVDAGVVVGQVDIDLVAGQIKVTSKDCIQIGSNGDGAPAIETADEVRKLL